MKEKRNSSYYINLIIIFFITSFFGWLWETIYFCFRDNKFINRGSLYGPYLPIYGYGSILLILFLYKERKKIIKFFECMTFMSILEYISSYLIEKIFHKKYWDYSHEFLNLNGRICLINSILFGIFGYILLTYIYPFLNNKLNKISKKKRIIISCFLIVILIIDHIISFIKPNGNEDVVAYILKAL